MVNKGMTVADMRFINAIGARTEPDRAAENAGN